MQSEAVGHGVVIRFNWASSTIGLSPNTFDNISHCLERLNHFLHWQFTVAAFVCLHLGVFCAPW